MPPCRCAAPASACVPSIVAALAAAGVAQVSVRAPRLRVVAVRADPILNAAARLIASDAARRGGAPDEASGALSEALADEKTDAVVAIGGTGSGRNDTSVQTLARDRPPPRAWHGADAGRDRGVRICRARGRCCCCRGGSMPRSGFG